MYTRARAWCPAFYGKYLKTGLTQIGLKCNLEEKSSRYENGETTEAPLVLVERRPESLRAAHFDAATLYRQSPRVSSTAPDKRKYKRNEDGLFPTRSRGRFATPRAIIARR